MRILVTGGAGFIGSHVVDALISRGHKVTVLDNLSTGKKENLNPKAVFVRGAIESEKTEKLVRDLKPEAIFHFAAQKDVRLSVVDPVADAKVNVLGFLRLVRAGLDINLKRFVFASTGGAIYGGADKLPTPENYPANPLSPYGVAKLAAEHYLHAYRVSGGFPAIALRFGNVYGPRQASDSECGVTAVFIRKLLSGERPIVFGDGAQTRDYIFVDDITRACLKALTTRHLGTYNIGTGVETDLNEILKMLRALIGSDVKPVYAPAKLGEERRSSLAIDRAKKYLGFEPKVALAQGLAKTIAWQKKRFGL